MSTFKRTTHIRFAHCDPAGIMFYPQLVVLANELVEDWFASMGASFKAMHVDARKGVPTVRFEAEFLSAFRLGDELTQMLRVTHVGRTSCRLQHEALNGGVMAARFEQTLAYVDLDSMKAEPWPDALRAAMLGFSGDEG